MADSFSGRRRVGRLIRMIHSQSGIDTRYACTTTHQGPVHESRFAPGTAPAQSATTAERMAIYEREAVPLGTAAARHALENYARKVGHPVEQIAGSITHLLAISCTGFFAPGLDFGLAKALNLPPSVRRTLIGFMGCAATFNGLRIAMEIVRGQPQARVLVVSVELCSLHCQPSEDYDLLVGASIFSDGASACLVGQPGPTESDFFSLDEFYTGIQPNSEEEMAWQIRDHGFVLRLSPQIPNHLAAAAPVALKSLFGSTPPQFWAIHPGGRAIVDRLAEIFELTPEALAASRRVLRQYGNMSSATILFVLETLRQTLAHTMARNGREHPPAAGVAMAFGPGLVVEMSRLTYVPPASQPVAAERIRLEEKDNGGTSAIHA
jgi:predicted naringenin-chalcone synthase